MVGDEAQRVIAQVQDLVRRAGALQGKPAELRERARQQTSILASDRVSAALRAIPVLSLKGAAGRGARLQQVHDGGFRTVADVVSGGAHKLQALPGVGPGSAQQIHAAAAAVAARVAAETRYVVDPDRRDSAQTELLATLAETSRIDAAMPTLRQPISTVLSQTKPLIEAADRTTSRSRMLFAGRTTKNDALVALGRLQAILADPRVIALSKTIDEQLAAPVSAERDARRLWADYLANAARYNALLSTVGGAGEREDDEAAQGYITPELRQLVSATPLDQTLLKSTLRGYQVFGAQYAIHQQRSMLGDEMGLGKTVQALAAMTHLAAKGQSRFIVVCPASVQVNWVNEIAKHTQLTARVLHGSDRDRAARQWARSGGVAVTTFGTLKTLTQHMTTEVALAVVDEAHYVKNPATQRAIAVVEALDKAQRVLFLTGTPMENRVEEFRNLVAYLQPQVAARVDARDAIGGAKRFRRAVAPVYLRRNQVDVLRELPEKIETEDWVYPTSADDEHYRSAVGSKNLMAMRQAAYDSADSAKLVRLAEVVEEAAQAGRKVLVFSYFLGVLELVARRVGPAVVGTITGAVSPGARQNLVDTFTAVEGHAVLLSQVEAGGVGLNVQAASIVILAEPQWKPSTEDQAIARAHRMGQTSTVQVHRLLAKGTIDERLQELKDGKRLLFDEFARKSDAKDADARAVDDRLAVLDDDAVPVQQRVMKAERLRLGLAE